MARHAVDPATGCIFWHSLTRALQASHSSPLKFILRAHGAALFYRESGELLAASLPLLMQLSLALHFACCALTLS